MKKHYPILLVVMFLILAQGVFWSCKKKTELLSPSNKIFVRYDAAKDSLFLRDSEKDKWVNSGKHLKEVKRGDTLEWHWYGPHNDLSFVSATPKDPTRNPFKSTIEVCKKLEISIKPASELDTGWYKYDLNININGNLRTFDPTLLIH